MTSSPLDKLQGMFTRKDTTPGLSADDFRRGLERTLSQSKTGQHLLAFALQQRIVIEIITGKGASGYIPENRAVYISLPANLSTIPAETVLELGAYLRQAELQFLGVKNPDISITSVEQAVTLDTKILDNIIAMCKISSELYEKGHADFIDALNRMGHGDIYRSFAENGTGDHLVDVYYKVYGK